jgi:hypothetical protein
LVRERNNVTQEEMKRRTNGRRSWVSETPHEHHPERPPSSLREEPSERVRAPDGTLFNREDPRRVEGEEVRLS